MPNSIENIVDACLGKYSKLSSLELMQLERNGRRDGKKEFPVSGATDFQASELTIVARVITAWAGCKQHINAHLRIIDQEIAGKKELVEENGILNRIANYQKTQQNEQNALITEYGPGAPEHSKLIRDRDSAHKKLDALKIKLGREIKHLKHKKTYAALLILLSIVEVPVNKMAFELVFEESSLLIPILAFSVGSIFMYFAHIWGKRIKEHMEPLNNMPLKSTLIISALIGAGYVFAVTTLVKMREKLFNIMNIDDSFNAQEFLESGNVVSQIAETTISSAGAGMMMINFAIIATGFTASYFRHDSHPEYEKLHDNYLNASNDVAKYDVSFNHKLVAIATKYNKHIEFEERVLAEEMDVLNRKREERKNDIKAIDHALSHLVENTATRILQYQKGNIQLRTTDAPLYFGDKHLSSILKDRIDPDDHWRHESEQDVS